MMLMQKDVYYCVYSDNKYTSVAQTYNLPNLWIDQSQNSRNIMINLQQKLCKKLFRQIVIYGQKKNEKVRGSNNSNLISVSELKIISSTNKKQLKRLFVCACLRPEKKLLLFQICLPTQEFRAVWWCTPSAAPATWLLPFSWNIGDLLSSWFGLNCLAKRKTDHWLPRCGRVMLSLSFSLSHSRLKIVKKQSVPSLKVRLQHLTVKLKHNSTKTAATTQQQQKTK